MINYKGVTSRRKGGLLGDNFKEKGWSAKGVPSRKNGGLQKDNFKEKGWSTMG